MTAAAPVVVEGRPARLLFVHAHPDDELLATGVAIAHHVAAGDEVHVLTCTLGEQGEVIPAELAHLTADREDTLGAFRRDELRGAMATAGVRSSTVLGEGPDRLSRWRDSGMAGTPSAADPRCWVRSDDAEAIAAVTAVVTAVDPDLVITYDAQGGYAHPDHIRTHEVTRRAVAGLPEDGRPALFGTFTPRSWAREDREVLTVTDEVRGLGWTLPTGDFPPSVVDDAVVTHAVVDASAVERQTAALRHHRTQVTLGPRDTYALSNDIAARLSGREGYARLDPATGEPVPATVVGARPPLVARR
ncbi:N-acetyl-1-D-myo-inositol-2-amino-2-deoxy-alpha-D-glucopyranoside deacetylase [Janibacter hoylei]|uniref:N-acetyl-1-D-myo-inositol-2-amino-2-deoxy-alpha- D-glucopyranoside deacetylase n=1 Tax=Janibacter hoylei TaxID=364298 RepID=UPI0021A36FB8|nr:N-acetyl-1-D-myo-inositol-2-amino-2-deoxy-alpha-D-glucopyranoside deacetylase [Janibacter hoylei]MCT1617996.1 N-acetyl-1-D-myo-inositol-2-amino-2-deoxy-alpha-D-glucopyranoside deacetylase [Janibacter hoylei]MCT2291665.1 N-acetyl-1-D-myo-inositol-2-amino-2-deoxy-alpha-D-glucopyranoside deacetylase [Janibacter hoylei]